MSRQPTAQRPIFSAGARIELAAAVLLVGTFLYFKAPIQAWLLDHLAPVHTSALGDCRPPTEHEQLHVVVLNRDGLLVSGGCLFVGSQSAYVKPHRPKESHANAHD